MADPIPTIPTIPTTPGLTAADLVGQQQAANQARQAQNVLDQQQLQQRAEKSIFKRVYNKSIKKGSLIAFQYNFFFA